MSESTRVVAKPQKPVMIFDGDCNFCRRWIRRWQHATGNAVDYVPFQDPVVAERYPELPRDRFEKAVHLIETDGHVFSGAEAVFRALACGRRKRWPLQIYQRVPGVAALTEIAYRFVAGHRTLFSALTSFFWGKHVEPPSHVCSRWLFLRLLGCIYLIAFISLWTQIDGLIGQNGIIPSGQFMRVVGQHFEQQHVGLVRRCLMEPTLCWFNATDGFLHLQCGAGTLLALLLVCGVASVPSLVLLWIIYLSLATVCHVFLGYQWDNLLLETGFLAIFLAPGNLLPRSPRREPPPSATALWLLRWLLFRLMFASGCVKLLSGDETWRNLTALTFHYETQPLPTWIGWFAHQLPIWFQKTSLVLMFGMELVVPFFIFFPRRLRIVACWAFIGLQVAIALTGNYCFFNFLTVLLCVLLLDDAALVKLLPRKLRQRFSGAVVDVSGQEMAGPSAIRLTMEIIRRLCVGIVAVIILILTGVQMASMFGVQLRPSNPLVQLYARASPFRTVNGYGLFAVMTTSRPEIVIEGSNDGQTWLAYEFKYKPGDVRKRPRFVAPHQPRLDWQMWFEALRTPHGARPNAWFLNFCHRLLQGSPQVLSLMEHNPFPEKPPKYIRAVVYDYHFTDRAALRSQGVWWRRDFKGAYGPVLSLRDEAEKP